MQSRTFSREVKLGALTPVKDANRLLLPTDASLGDQSVLRPGVRGSGCEPCGKSVQNA